MILLFGLALADSPLTTPELHQAYAEHPMVVRAAATGTLDDELAGWLSRPRPPLDEKVAVINALGWDLKGKDNATRYFVYLSAKHRKKGEDLLTDRSRLRPWERFALGYLMLMDDYFAPEKGLELVEAAVPELGRSRAAHVVLALGRAQAAMATDWCAAWQAWDAVAADVTLKADLRPEAEALAASYMALFQPSCPPPPPSDPEG